LDPGLESGLDYVMGVWSVSRHASVHTACLSVVQSARRRPSTELIDASTLCLEKNIPDVFSYNSRKNWRIFTIFGRNVTEKARNQKNVIFFHLT